MDSSDQRRKRKRKYNPLHLFSVRFFIICFVFLICLRFISHTSSSVSSPVFVASKLSLLSSSSSRTVKSVKDSGNLLLPLRIESRVLFPDHVLLFVSGGKVGIGSFSDEFDCVYGGIRKRVLSVDEYDGFRSIVRCPILLNYSNFVGLVKKIGDNGVLGGKNGVLGGENEVLRGKNGVLWDENGVLREENGVLGGKNGVLRGKNGVLGGKIGVLMRNQSVKSWENVVYSATVDKETDTAILFVKGLHLRPDRESDPSQFSCHYRLGKRNASMKALTAAQEVVRCPLPMKVRNSLDRGRGVRVTVGVSHRARAPVLMPSVAKIYGAETSGKVKKHELCVCSMVWNQASAIKEWIKYHSWVGVERWFIYDNNSDDGLDETIHELYRDNYNVSRHIWPWIKTQEAGFSHCALRAKDECDWVSFMDVDEYFYFPNSNSSSSQNSLRSLVANFTSSPVAEIRTSCHSFGPSGLKTRPVGVTVGYTCRLLNPERHKSIIRPDALDPTLLNVVHHFHLKKGFEYVNLPQSVAIINHYKYQVWEVFRAKFYRRVATYVVDWQENQNEGSRDRAPGLGTEAIEPPDWPQRFCEVWDTGLRDFVLENLSDLLPWEMHQDH